MFVGAARIRLHLPDNQSLKDKRQVIKPIIARVKNQFDVSIAETGEQDLWQLAELGIACVSSSARHADEVLNKVIGFVEGVRMDAEVTDVETEVVSVF